MSSRGPSRSWAFSRCWRSTVPSGRRGAPARSVGHRGGRLVPPLAWQQGSGGRRADRGHPVGLRVPSAQRRGGRSVAGTLAALRGPRRREPAARLHGPGRPDAVGGSLARRMDALDVPPDAVARHRELRAPRVLAVAARAQSVLDACPLACGRGVAHGGAFAGAGPFSPGAGGRAEPCATPSRPPSPAPASSCCSPRRRASFPSQRRWQPNTGCTCRWPR